MFLSFIGQDTGFGFYFCGGGGSGLNFMKDTNTATKENIIMPQRYFFLPKQKLNVSLVTFLHPLTPQVMCNPRSWNAYLTCMIPVLPCTLLQLELQFQKYGKMPHGIFGLNRFPVSFASRERRLFWSVLRISPQNKALVSQQTDTMQTLHVKGCNC